jgi:serine/threonine protein kinase
MTDLVDIEPHNASMVRRVEPFYFGSLLSSASAPVASGQQVLRRLLRIEFKNPKEDYTFVHEIRSNQGMLVCHRKNRFHLAVIRESHSPTPLQMLEVLAHVQHPNVADILDVYSHDSKLYIISEYLDVSMLDLEFERFAPEEWEIATIIGEVNLF